MTNNLNMDPASQTPAEIFNDHNTNSLHGGDSDFAQIADKWAKEHGQVATDTPLSKKEFGDTPFDQKDPDGFIKAVEGYTAKQTVSQELKDIEKIQNTPMLRLAIELQQHREDPTIAAWVKTYDDFCEKAIKALRENRVK